MEVQYHDLKSNIIIEKGKMDYEYNITIEIPFEN